MQLTVKSFVKNSDVQMRNRLRESAIYFYWEDEHEVGHIFEGVPSDHAADSGERGL